MNFWQLSDGIRLHHQPPHGHDGGGPHGLGRPADSLSSVDTGDDSAGDGGAGLFIAQIINSPAVLFSPIDSARSAEHGHADAYQSNAVQADQHAVQLAGLGGQGGSGNMAAGGDVSAVPPASSSVITAPSPATIDSGGNTAGNGGDGYFYGGIIHASMVVYEPINISVAAGYDSSALADQTNNVNFNQSALQMAGIGGNGGDGNIAAGGSGPLSSPAGSASEVITTGGNAAGSGGQGSFSGTLLDAPIVIYHPIDLAVAGPGGTAGAYQSNTVQIDQSVIQIAGVGGNGGNGNAAIGGEPSLLGSGSPGAWEMIQSGSNQAGTGGDGYAYGGLIHSSFLLYDPVNIAVAGYGSSAYAGQTNIVHLDQSSSQTVGVGGQGGSGNLAIGGGASVLSSGTAGASDTTLSGGNGAGNGGAGHFSGNLVDVSIAIYAPINIAIAGSHATAEADQVNNVHIDQSATQIAGIGGNGGEGNLALGGDIAAHFLSDLHLVA